jgi:hypothetical protein
MSWRLNRSIVRGEIDNRERGVVRGRIWLLGRPDPIRLELLGNCHRDLAGTVTAFVNPRPQPGDATDLAELQTGLVGDLTASRKIRGPAGSGETPPTANALYLEWFSEANGRVVLESADCRLVVSAPAWGMSAGEEAAQIAANREALRGWLDRWSGPSVECAWSADDDEPMDEFEWEKMLKESDAIGAKYSELLEKYADHPDRDRIIAREMGWNWVEETAETEEGEDGGTAGTDDPDSELWDEDGPLQPDPLTEGRDWVHGKDGRITHPLTHRATESALRMWHHCDGLGLLGERGDADALDMVFQGEMLGAKLAGALDHLGYDPDGEPGLVVASLKRSLVHLHNAIAAACRVAGRRTVQPALLDEFCQTLFEVREGVLSLMERFRNQLP